MGRSEQKLKQQMREEADQQLVIMRTREQQLRDGELEVSLLDQSFRKDVLGLVDTSTEEEVSRSLDWWFSVGMWE